MDRDHLELFVKGSIVGHLIGDAVGFPYKYAKEAPTKISMRNGEYPAGTYTDNGALMLCTMACFNESKDLQEDELIEKFNDLYIGGYLTPDSECHDMDLITVQAIKNYSNGMPTDKCGPKEENLHKAAPLSRMLPIGLFYSTDPIDELISHSHDACKLTHYHIRTQVACALYCLLIKNIVLQKSEKVFDILKHYYEENNLSEHKSELQHIKNWKETPTGTDDVTDCFWSAWKAYSENQDSFMQCIEHSVKYKNETDMVACIAGSMASLSNGLNDIPQNWLNTIRLTSETMETIQAFVEIILDKMEPKQ